MELTIVLVVNIALVVMAVLIHYETLYQLARRLPRLAIRPRLKVLLGVGVILLAHIAEIWLFALGYRAFLAMPGFGALTGFVLITWSASFLFLEMQKYWPGLDRHPR